MGSTAVPQLVVGRSLVPSFSKLTDPGEVSQYWTKMMKTWKHPAKRGFPGCNPVSIARYMLPCLYEYEYVISLKADGVRYVLYLTTRPGSTAEYPRPVALMIDRSKNMYEVDVMAREDMFVEGTILEGELVWKQPDETTLVFTVFDCVLSGGVSMVTLPFRDRLAEAVRLTHLSEELRVSEDVASRILETDQVVMMHFDPSVTIRPKTFVGRIHAARLWEERNQADHRVDGIVFQRTDAPYLSGTASDYSVLKWKESSTVDLAGHDTRASDGCLPANIFGKRVRVSDQSRIRPESDKQILEYLVDVRPDSIDLFALRTRLDKKTANSLHVVIATMRDVMEAVTPQELAAGLEE